MSISVSSPVIRKIKRYSLGQMNVDINIKKHEDLGAFFDYASIYDNFQNVINSIGAHICSGGGVNSKIGNNIIGAFVSEEFSSSVNDFFDTAVDVLSTGVVIGNSVVSGVAKIGENLVDGVAWTGGKVVDGFFGLTALGVGLFSKDAKQEILNAKSDFDQNVKDYIATDQIGEINKSLFEGTKLGEAINRNSYIKYDSDTAKTIQNVTTKGVEIGLATGATVLTGGLAAPASAAVVGAIGFTDAVGKAAEKHYANDEVGGYIEADIVLDGVVGALEWYSFGKMGSNAIGAVKAINQAGVEGIKATFQATSNIIKEQLASKGITGILKDGTKNVISKKNLLSALKLTLKDVDTYVDVSGILARDLKKYFSGEDIAIEDIVVDLGGVLITNIGFNTVTHGLMTKNEAEEFIKQNQEILIDTASIKGLIEQSDFNKQNLISGILDQMPDGLSEEESIRYIYLKLNQAVSYSDEYLSHQQYFHVPDNDIMYNDVLDMENMSNNNIVCSNWSQVYRDLLVKHGIDESKISILGKEGSHKYVMIDLGNDNVVVADGMISGIGGYTDVVNSKLGLSTKGFIVTTKKDYNQMIQQSGSHRDALYDLNVTGIYSKRVFDKNLIDIDKRLGYDTNKLKEEYDFIVNEFSQTRNVSFSDYNSLINYINNKDMSATDAFPVMRRLYNTLNIPGEVNMYYDGKSVIDVLPVVLDNTNVGYLYKRNNEAVTFVDDISSIVAGFKSYK